MRKNVREKLTGKGSGLPRLSFSLLANAGFEESASFNDMTKTTMKSPYRIYIRDKSLGGKVWWIQNTTTGDRESLGTKDKLEAQSILAIRNQPHKSASFHLNSARNHLSESKMKGANRTWQMVMDAIIKSKHGSTKIRWERAIKCKSFDHIRNVVVFEVTSDDFLKVMDDGKVSTNRYLRQLHNYAIDMNWLLMPVIAKKAWPDIVYGDKRAITSVEHQQIIEREKNPERRAYYEVCWHVGGAQSDMANLMAEDICWNTRTISFERFKNNQNSSPGIGSELEKILRSLPTTGFLFPNLAKVRESDRATEFKQRCTGLGILGVTLHSYRYSWAQRAKSAGYPERYAQAALGHGSKAVSRAYAKGGRAILPSLEEYESKLAERLEKLGEQAALAA